ncbi:peptidoglycan editing factor PgeF [Legionella oakridgensis]|uniref:Purine nucleoside phosphorylase n=2 Tax=Legionella oakridgensis TaxID=29423 RepID=W0BFL8_9GAMM|nr:peptidoglycan editing factor PgeF [Legionella oakridgensis]AHE67491.1 protein YfiH family [Legionella oakridgensis ATCC 33761 = DSM 21215]ETO92923.1 YfiH family protein [Legionella oakridgensis RV-2-2007]KTD38622.1 Laccase domain protein YfiH [Legionella oakridgensis]STY20539.1 Laccase domain protein yfiH [Legionella longbeachae]
MFNLAANWPAPENIFALTTTRIGGFSQPPYDSNNIALHVGDDETHVQKNRNQLRTTLMLPQEPVWLEQTHSNRCIVVEEESQRLADAAITRDKTYPLAIMTADCLPIMLCDAQGTEIAAIHAGWRGLVNGIIENTLAKMHSSSSDIMAWIGPAICQTCFEVGDDVWDVYVSRYPYTKEAFRKHNHRWLANLPQMAELILNTCGIAAVYQSSACTLEHEKQFYSYRREAQTGRMATLIWFKQDK